ncbi:MAG: hypothetical protein ABR562_09160 [Thermoplasmatota archaeon]|nr:hypothetical protein [Halobacteriales archaeon]
MRVLVTGPMNAVGSACVRALAAAGHEVRAFGVPAGEDPFHGVANVECYPGDVATGGSIEPVASECRAFVHASPLDAPGKDRRAHAVKVERGTLYARYGAERELVDRFVCVLPQSPEPAWMEAVEAAERSAKAAREVPVTILRATARDPEAAAREAVRILGPAATAPAATAPAATAPAGH